MRATDRQGGGRFVAWRAGAAAVLSGLVVLLTACPAPQPPAPVPGNYQNTTDPTNGGATYIGAFACTGCHAPLAREISTHGHAQALKRSGSSPPVYPAAGTRAGVPNPPTGRRWSDISYVIGGYLQGAFFIDADGYLMTDGTAGVNTAWALTLPANGTAAGFASFRPEQVAPLPLSYDCFRCHVTGARPLSASNPRPQDGRPGIGGTWAEPGVQCEACHGPASRHPNNAAARDLYVDLAGTTCQECHTLGGDPDVIVADGGYVSGMTQAAELRASGGHAGFQCGFCHDPHHSVTYDRARALRNQCTDCHPDVNMALHAGKVFRRGGYTEALTCESCHMSYAARNVSAATAAVVGALGRMGDVRSHIFRIDATAADYTQMFAAGGAQVRKDAAGRAAQTLDFVCLRCHNGVGSAFPLDLAGAASVAAGVHAKSR